MNSKPVKLALTHFSLWLVLVGIVFLLTLVFSLFGTLGSAALAGMMLGATKHRRWLTLPVSAIFPGVVFTLMWLSKVELEGQKRIVVPALCFGLFWMTYFLTCVMVGFETKAEDSSVQSITGRATPTQSHTKAATPANQTQPVEKSNFELLQGRWQFESTHPDGHAEKKLIEIAGNRLTLSAMDPEGRVRLLASGKVCLEIPKPPKATIASTETQSSGDGS